MIIFRWFCIYILLLICDTSKIHLNLSEVANEVRFVGRFDFSTLKPRAMWPGSSFTFSLEPLHVDSYTKPVSNRSDEVILTVTFKIIDPKTLYVIDVFFDEIFYHYYEISETNNMINISTILTDYSLDVEYVKVTESSVREVNGIMEVESIIVDGRVLVSQPLAKTSRLLFIGDSFSVGYGVEGQHPCKFSAATENVLDAYPSIVSKHFDADMHVIAWSGKGVIRNYGDRDRSIDPMPIYYNRTIATDSSSYWDPSKFLPDLVWVMLGLNDFSTNPHPSNEDFIQGLVALLLQVKLDYPHARIVAACPPDHYPGLCENTETAALKAEVKYVIFDANRTGRGCDYHPDKNSQMNYANAIIEAVAGIL